METKRQIAYTNVTNDDWVMATPEPRLVRVAEGVLEQFGSRTEDGRKITASWSEPYDDGTYEIIFHVSGEPELTMLRNISDELAGVLQQMPAPTFRLVDLKRAAIDNWKATKR